MSVVQGEYLRVSCNFELGDGTAYQNTYAYLRDGADPVSDVGVIANVKSHMEDLYATLVAHVRNDVVEKLCFIDKVAWVTDEWKIVANIGTFTPTFTPAGAGEGLPYMSAPFLYFKTTRPKSVGKKFLFPFTEGAQDETILVAAAVTSMTAYGVLAITDIALDVNADLIPGILRTGVEVWLSFQVAVVNDIIGSQKRRRPGVGA